MYKSKTEYLLEELNYFKTRVINYQTELYDHIIQTFNRITFGNDREYFSKVLDWLESFDKNKPEIIIEKLKHVLSLDGTGNDDIIKLFYTKDKNKNISTICCNYCPRRIIQSFYDKLYEKN